MIHPLNVQVYWLSKDKYNNNKRIFGRHFLNDLPFFYQMQNDPELNGKYLGSITKDFVKIADNLKDASYQIRVRGISKYPIFPISRVELPIGQVFLGTNDMEIEWNYNMSFLDEFVQRGLVAEEKIPEFEEAYKNPDEFCCLFVVDVNFTNFIFIPYPED